MRKLAFLLTIGALCATGLSPPAVSLSDKILDNDEGFTVAVQATGSTGNLVTAQKNSVEIATNTMTTNGGAQARAPSANTMANRGNFATNGNCAEGGGVALVAAQEV